MSQEGKRKGRHGSLKVRRLPVTFRSDFRRVITRFFDPGGEARIRNVVDRVRGLSDAQVDRLLDEVFLKFRTRHGSIASVLDENYRTALALDRTSRTTSRTIAACLIGSYLTAEYSIESAALFNPSIVPHHNQRNIPAGAVRFIMSLRATGEGHVSSIVFRTGVIYSDHQIQIDPCSRFTKPVRVVPDKQYDKPLFRRKLKDIGVNEAVTGPRSGSPRRLVHLGPTRTCHHRERGLRHPRRCNSRNRSRTSVGWPTRTTSWSFRGKRRLRNW